MLFNSYIFVFAFLPAALAGWWLLPNHRWRLIWLTLASYVFYGWWNWRFIPLMIVSTSADFIAGRAIHRAESERTRRAWLIALLLFNLGLLAVFKYADFFAATWNALAPPLGAPPMPLFHVVLPIGISFYTFNSISYTIDVYRRRLEPSGTFVEFAAFVAMFPHLIAGPIVRYADMGEQFQQLRRVIEKSAIATGMWLFVIGMAKKVLVADIIASQFVTPLFASADHLGLVMSWTAVVGYTLQIYFDFSAYSDMAVGLALFLGLRFPQNFDSPYKAVNPSDFWRRWHISLSSWLRDYLFIPLGGSRGGRWMTMRNLVITMFLGGLWHGASWTFVIWGLYHGTLLVIHAAAASRGWVPKSKAVSIAMTFVAVMIGWVFFRAESMSDAWAILSGMMGLRGVDQMPALIAGLAKPQTLWLIGGLAAVFTLPNTWEMKYPRTVMSAIVLAALFTLCILRFGSPSPFIYYQF